MKPQRAADYTPASLARSRAACLELATRLGDLVDDLVVVGGLAPSLMIEQGRLPEDAARHVGTMDVDVGLALGLLQRPRYELLRSRLKAAGLEPDRNDRGHITAQRWRVGDSGPTVDFLIAPPSTAVAPGSLQHLETDLAAVVTPGLDLAFRDCDVREISGPTLTGGVATRSIRVCGPGAYIVLKALAFGNRGERKDAYDLYYVLCYFGASQQDIVVRTRPLLSSQHAREALRILRRDFATMDAIGPSRVAAFIGGSEDLETQADVAGLVESFLHELGEA